MQRLVDVWRRFIATVYNMSIDSLECNTDKRLIVTFNKRLWVFEI